MSTHPDLEEIIELRRRLPEPSERRAIRDRTGISRELASRDLGVSMQTLASWETGTATPRGANLVAYVDLLDRLRQTAEIPTDGAP